MRLSKRELILGAGAMAAFGGAAFGAPAGPRLSQRLGVQLYVLSDLAADAMPAALQALSKIGYREVEGMRAPTAAAWRRELDRANLRCPSIGGSLDSDPERAAKATAKEIADAKAVGARTLVLGGFPIMERAPKGLDLADYLGDATRLEQLRQILDPIMKSLTAEDWVWYARQMNEKGAKLDATGLRIACHNHNTEFAKLANGRTIFDLLIAETDPKLVDFELDLGWVRAAGLDPAAVLKRHASRVTQLHMKDLRETKPNFDGLMNPADLGTGVQDWNGIADAIKGSAVRHVFFEQEPPYPASGLKSATVAYAYLQPLLAKKGL